MISSHTGIAGNETVDTAARKPPENHTHSLLKVKFNPLHSSTNSQTVDTTVVVSKITRSMGIYRLVLRNFFLTVGQMCE